MNFFKFISVWVYYFVKTCYRFKYVLEKLYFIYSIKIFIALELYKWMTFISIL